MKRPIIYTLSVLLTCAGVSSLLKAQAEEVIPKPTNTPSIIRELKPFELVVLAYRGRFRKQGIPSYENFLITIDSGRITAKKLVEVAIGQNLVSPETVENRKYLRAVRAHLRNLDVDNAGE